MDVYTEPAAHGKPEQGQSPRFLKLLDPSAGGFTFQTFDDDRARKNSALTRIVESPPPARLVKLNKQGAVRHYQRNRWEWPQKREHHAHSRSMAGRRRRLCRRAPAPAIDGC
jgi:hypothetical protein